MCTHPCSYVAVAIVRFPSAPRPTPVMNEHFDVIIIGTGAGCGTLLNRLAPSDKNNLVLERGPFLPREKENWSYKGSFKYYSSEKMFNKDGGAIYPGFSYHVGGNTKVYGRRCSGCAKRILNRSAIATAFRPSGRSSITIGKIITRKPRSFFKFTARLAKTRLSR